MPSLPLLILSLVAAASTEATTAAHPPPRGPDADARAQAKAAAALGTNAERAKVGLLPRRMSRSRVRYPELAAAGGKRIADSPAFEVLPEPPDDTVTEVAFEPDAEGEPEPAEDGGTQPAEEAEEMAPPAPPAGDAPALASEPPEATQVAPPPPAAPAAVEQPPAEAAQVPAPRNGRRTVAARVATVERTIGEDGKIVLRVLGPDSAVIAVKVGHSVTRLPVLSSKRAEDGSIVERVEDEWGPIEIRRDAVGRFVSAQAEGSSED